MKIITKALTRSDIYDIVFKLDPVSIDLTLVNEFSTQNEAVLTLVELQSELEKVPVKLGSNSTLGFPELEVFFTRAYHLFLLLACIKNRKEIRGKVSDFLVLMLNKRIKTSAYYGKPFSVLYSFYGENAVSAIIDSLSKLPSLTKKEKEVLVPYLEKAYYFSLAVVNYFKIINSLALGEASFAFFCEQNCLKNDFLLVKYEKRTNNKFVSPTAGNVMNLISGTKFSKATASTTTATWVDIVAQIKAITQESLNSILEEANSEESENLEDLKIKEGNYNVKNWQFYNNQAITFLTGIISLIANSIERLKESKDIEKEFALKLEKMEETLAKKRGELVSIMTEYIGKTEAFGQGFGAIWKAADFINFLLDILSIEALSSYRNLDALNDSLIQKTAKPKKEEEKEKDVPTKKPRKIQLGRGTNDLFTKFEEDYSAKLKTKVFEQGAFEQFCDYFSPFNMKLIEDLADMVSAKNEERRKPKIPKGTRDMNPLQMTIRRKAIEAIGKIFRKHGAVEIDTPVFELRETLMGKYGEASKLIYDLQDQGGEQLSLRYDLTVPFARYLAMKNITNIKKFHIAKVYRRDQPQMNKGRYREFYQCDFDIAGSYGLMLPDAECIFMMVEIFKELDLGGKVVIKINHRKLLDAVVELSGAPHQKFKTICSSIDKLDKDPWEEVRRELIEEKGLTTEMANKIGQFVVYKGQPTELLAKIKKDEIFKGSEKGEAALKEFEVLFKYLEEMGCADAVTFDLSLARGLDYYTGIIYEAILEGASVGSIAGGGRYDELVGMFSGKDIPAVGFSIGIERIFAILEKKHETDANIRASDTELIVGSIGSGMVTERLKLCRLFWEAGINAETLFNENPKPQKQLQYALENYVPFITWVGEDEVKKGVVKLKSLYKSVEFDVPREKIVEEVQKQIAIYKDELAKGLVKYEKPDEAKDGEEKGEEKGKGRGRGKGKEGKEKEGKEKDEKVKEGMDK